MKRIIPAASATTMALLPMLVLAQFGEIDTFLGNVLTFINNVLIPLIFGVALLVFIWGMFQYFIRGGASDGEREKGKQLMIYAVVGFVLMVSVWGIVNLIAGGLGFTDSNINNIPNGPSVR